MHSSQARRFRWSGRGMWGSRRYNCGYVVSIAAVDHASFSASSKGVPQEQQSMLGAHAWPRTAGVATLHVHLRQENIIACTGRARAGALHKQSSVKLRNGRDTSVWETNWRGGLSNVCVNVGGINMCDNVQITKMCGHRRGLVIVGTCRELLYAREANSFV